MNTGRFRVTVNGFRVNAQTWDDALNWDGWGDEVFFKSSARVVNADKSEGDQYDRTTAVMGDTSAYAPKVWAGTGKPTGGLITGDTFPGSEPWKKSRSANLDQEYPPFRLWEGKLTQKQDTVFIALALYEWDPGENFLQGLIEWLGKSITKLKQADLFGPTAKKVFEGFELGLDVMGSFPLGDSGTKPIGIRKAGKSGYGEFTPKVIVLNYDNAIQLINNRPSGRDFGVIEINYYDDVYYAGNYSIFVQIEYLVDEDAVIKSDLSQKVYTVVGGGKLWIDSPSQLDERYGGATRLEVIPQGVLEVMPDYPMDGTLIQEWEKPEVYVMYAGAKIWIPSFDELKWYGAVERIRKIPVNAASRLPHVPRPGTVFVERGTRKRVLFSQNGVQIPWFEVLGMSAYTVPDGTLDRI
jgi:hypothetical protein